MKTALHGGASWGLLLLAVLSLAAEAMGSPRELGDFSRYPRMTPQLVKDVWRDPMLADLLAAQELLRNELSPLGRAYPGQRSVFNNLPPGPYDVTRVDADVYVNLNDQLGAITVEARLTIVALEPGLDKLSFNLELPEMEKAEATPPFEIVAQKQGGSLNVFFSQELPVEEEVVLTLRYKGVMDCGVKFMLATCKLTGGWKYITHSQFLPYSSDFDDIYSGTLTLFVYGKDYEKYHAGGTGTYKLTRIHQPEGIKEIVFEHTYPTGLYAFSLGTLATVHGLAQEIPIAATARTDQLANQGTTLSIVQDVLEAYSDMFVVYPWNKLDIIAMPKEFSGGFGPLSSVFVHKSTLDAKAGENSFYSSMQLLSHEIAHQWWGNLVEMADMSSILVSEGAAEFSSNYYFELATGSRWPFISNAMSYTFTVPPEQDPIMVSPFVYASPYYYQVAYQKGSATFDMLRLEIGDELLLAALKEVTTRYHSQYASWEDVYDVIAEVSGVDLTYFEEQWLMGKGHIQAGLLSDCHEDSTACRLTVKQEAPFTFNLPVYLDRTDGPGEFVTLRVDEQEKAFDLPAPPGTLRRVLVDPHRRLTRLWYALLPGDIDLSGAVDGADLVEMSFAYQVNLLAAADWGEFFFANPYYNELADVARDDGEGMIDGRVNEADLDVMLANFGKMGEEP
jgi:hypothetical protein